jgi:hypothetical protein
MIHNKVPPELKAWYFTDSDTFSESDNILSTVPHLKQAICLQVPALRKFGVNGHQLVLLLDNFELLDGSPLNDVRDGDLVCIRSLPSKTLFGYRYCNVLYSMLNHLYVLCR